MVAKRILYVMNVIMHEKQMAIERYTSCRTLERKLICVICVILKPHTEVTYYFRANFHGASVDIVWKILTTI